MGTKENIDTEVYTLLEELAQSMRLSISNRELLKGFGILKSKLLERDTIIKNQQDKIQKLLCNRR